MNEIDGSLVFAIVFMLVALWGLFPSLRHFSRLAVGHRWPVAQARIDSATLGQLRNGQYLAPYVAAVRYSFSVNGQDYRGTFVLRGTSRDEVEVKAACSALVGGIVTIRYKSKDPNISLLGEYFNPRFGRLRATQDLWTLKIAPISSLGDVLK
jgi:hypothetical protein